MTTDATNNPRKYPILLGPSHKQHGLPVLKGHRMAAVMHYSTLAPTNSPSTERPSIMQTNSAFIKFSSIT